MTYERLVIGLAIFYLLSIAMAFYWGFTYAVDKYQLGNLEAFLKRKFPDKWKAYKVGVDEGYTQGLRDGQEPLE